MGTARVSQGEDGWLCSPAARPRPFPGVPVGGVSVRRVSWEEESSPGSVHHHSLGEGHVLGQGDSLVLCLGCLGG